MKFMQYYLGKWIFNFVFLIGVAVLNLPNVLTISRIVVIPVIFLSIYIHSVLWSILAGALFVTASITDYLDGYFARSRNQNSVLGRLLDPIADKLLPFYEAWFERSPCEYLLCTTEGQHLDYFNYCDTYWDPLMEEYDMKHTPHDTRHTCISMMADAGVAPTIQKKIAGHSGAMSLTERVYTHLDIQTLIDGINMICPV